MKKLLAILTLTVLFSTSLFAQQKVKTYKVNVNPERVSVLKGGINPYTVNPILKTIRDLDNLDNGKIYLIINSYGGSVESGMELVSMIKSTKNPIICIIESKAYSMAAILATYCTRTYIHKYASVMFHEATFTIIGKENVVENRLRIMQKSINIIHKEVANNLNIPIEEYKKKIRNEWWLTANESVQRGVARGIVTKLKYPAPSFPRRWVSPFFNDFPLKENPFYDLRIE